MRLVGDEKRIQALFRELKQEDLQVVPGFDSVWTNARVSRSETPGVKKSLGAGWMVLTFALVVISGMVLLSGGKEGAPEIPRLAIVEMKASIVIQHQESLTKRKIVRRVSTQTARQTIPTDAVALSMWKSPTLTFMDAPAGAEINSLPQLNQASKELEAFLPDVSDGGSTLDKD